MKRLAKSVSATLCASILCSSVLCYNAFTAFAEDTTTAETTASTEASTAVSENVKVDDAEVISIGALDKNDFVESAPNAFYYNAKKDGYYCVIYFDGESYCNPFLGEDVLFDDYKEAISFKDSYKAGASLTFASFFSSKDFYVIYSANGVDNLKVLHMSPADMSSIESGCSLEGSSYISEKTDEHAIIVFDVNTKSAGVLLSNVDIYKADENGYCLYSTSEDLIGKTAGSFPFIFTENGEYLVEFTSTDGSTLDFNVNVENIDSSIKNEDKFEDFTAPEIIVSLENKSGLEDGDTFKVTISTNEACDIDFCGQYAADSTKAEFYVSMNGLYTVKATDSWGNTSEKEVKITSFGDGTFPENINYNIDDINENIIALGNTNKDSFWEDAANGKISGVSSTSGSTSLSTLPQTGGFKIACVVLSSGIAIAGGAFVLKKNGFKFKSRKGKGDK